MNWTAYVIMHWLPTYLRVTFHADPTGISLAALPYLANSLFAIGSLLVNLWICYSRQLLLILLL